MSSGVFYISSGDDRRQLLFDSLATVQRYEPQLPIHVVTDAPLDVSFTWARRSPGGGANFYKTRMANFSPFDSTLYLSLEMRLNASIGGIDAVLGDRDLALVPDAFQPTLGRLAGSQQALQSLTPPERELMRNLARERADAPYFETNVIFFRKTESLRHLFALWQEEWLRFEHHDQPALARALVRHPIPVRVLPPEFCCIRGENSRESVGWTAGKIVHFTALDERFLPPLTRPPKAFTAFREAVAHGLCTNEQYEILGRLILLLRPLKFLVFGCGADSALWNALNCDGHTRFVESDPRFARRALDIGLNVIEHSFPTQRGQPAHDSLKAMPAFMQDLPWDVVFLDGPPGYSPQQPGRELPICWTSQLGSNPVVFLHDYERNWERACADRYLGPPDLRFAGNAQRPQELAIWLRDRVKSSALVP